MMETDAIVIGAGAVGLACASGLARAGYETIALEAENAIGTGISARNSEVIHAGIYYPTGSLKHRLCMAGQRRLYDWCEARGVPYRRTGKLVVATDAGQLPALQALHEQGRRNGVESLRQLTGAEARTMEPNLQCLQAVQSAETGILDSHAYMLSLQGALEDQGGAVALNAPAERIEPLPDGRFRVSVGGADPSQITAPILVNSAGLQAVRVARRMEDYDPELIPPLTLAKGNYFSCHAPKAFNSLIYPMPDAGGLGVHVTLDLAGRMRLGPDVEWLDHDDPDRVAYAVDPERAEGFYAAARRYWPGLADGALVPDYSGCRPKLSARGAPAADFRIDGTERHGFSGLVHLYGIESPGLTSSLAIADEVVARLS